MIIAERMFDGHDGPVTLKVHAPTPDQEDFRCDFEIFWGSETTNGYGMGVDSVQALSNALISAHIDLLMSPAGRTGELWWLGMEDLGLPVPADISREAIVANGKRITGWKLDRMQRTELLNRLKPAYVQVVADHVTLHAGASATEPLPPEAVGQIIGMVDDGKGVQAMVVSIDGTTTRPTGGTYHITWSLGPGRRAVQSNDAIAEHGWRPLPEPIPVTLRPAELGH